MNGWKTADAGTGACHQGDPVRRCGFFITKPTTLPRKLFEVDAAARFPGAVLKSSRSYDLKSFAQIKREADLRGVAVDQMLVIALCRLMGAPFITHRNVGALLLDMYVDGAFRQHMRIGSFKKPPEESREHRLSRVAGGEIHLIEFALRGLTITWSRVGSDGHSLEIWSDNGVCIYSTSRFGGWRHGLRNTLIPFLLNARLTDIRERVPAAVGEASLRRTATRPVPPLPLYQIRELEERLIGPVT